MKPNYQKLTELVSPARIAAMNFDVPTPVSVKVSPKVDHSGDDSLEVDIVFPEGTPYAVFENGKVTKVVQWVRRMLREETEGELFPYTNVSIVNEAPVCH
jgi:hypothetical protein